MISMEEANKVFQKIEVPLLLKVDDMSKIVNSLKAVADILEDGEYSKLADKLEKCVLNCLESSAKQTAKKKYKEVFGEDPE